MLIGTCWLDNRFSLCNWNYVVVIAQATTKHKPCVLESGEEKRQRQTEGQIDRQADRCLGKEKRSWKTRQRQKADWKTL